MDGFNKINEDLWIGRDLLVQVNDESIRFKLNNNLQNLDRLPSGPFHIIEVYSHKGWQYEDVHRTGCVRLILECPRPSGETDLVKLDVTGDAYQDVLAENLSS
jgi:hypothetical protein